MPRTTCCVPGCCKRGGYHFPLNSELKKAWLKAIQRVNWIPKDSSTVCKDHFIKQDFLCEAGVSTDQLKKNSVPSLFWWTNSIPSYDENTDMKKISISPKKKGFIAKKKGVSTHGRNVSSYKLPTNAAPESASDLDEEEFEEEEDYEEGDEEEDEFEDAGAIEDSDDEYRGEDDEVAFDDDDDDDDILEDDDVILSRSHNPKGVKGKRGQQQKPKMQLTLPPKSVSKKRQREEAEDTLLTGSKRSRMETLPEYSRQLNKAYKEISRLSTRCQVLDAALKNKSVVGHRARTLYQIGKYVLPHQLSFIESQAMNSTLAPGQRRWSRRMRNISLGLHRHSRHAYNFMAKIFALPTEAELQKWGAQNETGTAEGDVPSNNVSLVEAEALVDEVTFDNLMSVIL